MRSWSPHVHSVHLKRGLLYHGRCQWSIVRESGGLWCSGGAGSTVLTRHRQHSLQLFLCSYWLGKHWFPSMPIKSEYGQQTDFTQQEEQYMLTFLPQTMEDTYRSNRVGSYPSSLIHVLPGADTDALIIGPFFMEISQPTDGMWLYLIPSTMEC